MQKSYRDRRRKNAVGSYWLQGVRGPNNELTEAGDNDDKSIEWSSPGTRN